VPPLAAGYAALDGYAAVHDEAIARGATEDQADKAGFENGAAQGALAALPVPGLKYGGRLVDKLVEKPLLKFFAKGATTATTTAAYGAASQATSNLVAQQNYDPDRPLGQGVGNAALLSGTIGLAGHGLAAVNAARMGRGSAGLAARAASAPKADRTPRLPPETLSATRETGSDAAPRRGHAASSDSQPELDFDGLGAPTDRTLGANPRAPAAETNWRSSKTAHSGTPRMEQTTNIRGSTEAVRSRSEAASPAPSNSAGDFSDLGSPVTPTTEGGVEERAAPAPAGSPTDSRWTSNDLGSVVLEPLPQTAEPSPDAADLPDSVASDLNSRPVALRKTWRQRIREVLLGRTPDKFSRTGRHVVARMRTEGKIIGDGPLLRGNPHGLKLKLDDNTFVHIDGKIDMAHKVPAVSWWNETGIHHGAKSPEVRRFMLDPNNYELRHMGPNRSEGGKMKEIYKIPESLNVDGYGEMPDD
jgi:hypothetical protein